MRPILHVGFTGTRRGMTETQRTTVSDMLAKAPGAVVHHGDCVGADADFHAISAGLGHGIVIHPPDESRHRAFCRTDGFLDEVLDPLPYLVRNRAIVRASAVLIATPFEASEQPTGGTWFTIAYARQRNMPVRVVWPDGTVARSGLPTGRREPSGRT